MFNYWFKKSMVFIITNTIIVVSFLPVITGYNSVSNGIIYVDDDGGADYTKIQDAIDNASNGDTVCVFSGIYFEVIKLYKQVSIIGIDNGGGKPVIDGRQGSEIYTIEIMNDYCTLDNFILKNSGSIWLNGKHCIISNNDLIGPSTGYAWWGIFISSNHKSDYSKIQNNTIDTNYRIAINSYYGGSDFLEISDNTIMNTYGGIWLESSPRHCDILRNQIYSIRKHGLVIDGGGFNRIIGNNITSCLYGIFFYKTRNGNEVKINSISSNKEAGLAIIDHFGGDYIIENNNFIKNEFYGLVIHYSDFGEPCTTLVTKNNFINNCIDAIYTFNSRGIRWKKNYWDEPRIFPKPIQGGFLFAYGGIWFILLPIWRFDWRPVCRPYNINISEVL